MFHAWQNSAGAQEATIIVSDQSRRKIPLVEICQELSGFCQDPQNQIHDGPLPKIELSLSGGDQPVLVPVTQISPEAFDRILIKLKLAPKNNATVSP